MEYLRCSDCWFYLLPIPSSRNYFQLLRLPQLALSLPCHVSWYIFLFDIHYVLVSTVFIICPIRIFFACLTYAKCFFSHSQVCIVVFIITVLPFCIILFFFVVFRTLSFHHTFLFSKDSEKGSTEAVRNYISCSCFS